MQTNRWIELSQHFYRRLLHLYPQNYRVTYEEEMFRVFTDQCREAYEQRGKPGILSLWPRILVDLGLTVTQEHLADPQAKLGLLDARPDTPLPWKGVLLVLIPGLIFFISQIEQLTSSNDWFFLAFYRASYFLILPVLLVWLFTRRFPVWGLIPLGLLYNVLGSYNPDYLIGKLPFSISSLYPPGTEIYINYLLLVSGCIVLLGILIWYNAHRREISLPAWGWLVLYSLLVIVQIIAHLWYMVASFATAQGLDLQAVMNLIDIKQNIIYMTLWYLYSPVLFLLLIFIGKLFARKYGGLSFLILLGYLLPTIVFGRYGEWNNALPFYLVSTAVLVYRFVVALIAPVWLVRAASEPKRKRGAAIPVAIAILCQVSLNVIVYLAWRSQYNLPAELFGLALIIWNQLILAAGLGLAVTLYLPKPRTAIASPAPAVTT